MLAARRRDYVGSMAAKRYAPVSLEDAEARESRNFILLSSLAAIVTSVVLMGYWPCPDTKTMPGQGGADPAPTVTRAVP